MPRYFDCNATTPVCEAAIDAVVAAMRHCGNASSAHEAGAEAAVGVARGRAQVARLLGVPPASIAFTAGATEANNLAIRGVVTAARRDGIAKPRVITSDIEHSSVLATLRELEAAGQIELAIAPARAEGIVRVDCIKRRLTPSTVLVTIMAANNETGTLQPVEAIGRLCANYQRPNNGPTGVLFHADLCQSFGKIALDPSTFDLASMSGHKLYGPKGIGALYVRPAVRAWMVPQTTGGGQEEGLRAGTINSDGIAGFGAACDYMARTWPAEGRRLRILRDFLLALLRTELGCDAVHVNGAIDAPDAPAAVLRLPHNLNVSFPGVDNAAFHAAVRPFVCVSAGSACKALKGTRSHVLDAVGAPEGAVMRVGLPDGATETDVREAAEAIVAAARSSRVERTAPAAAKAPQPPRGRCGRLPFDDIVSMDRPWMESRTPVEVSAIVGARAAVAAPPGSLEYAFHHVTAPPTRNRR